MRNNGVRLRRSRNGIVVGHFHSTRFGPFLAQHLSKFEPAQHHPRREVIVDPNAHANIAGVAPGFTPRLGRAPATSRTLATPLEEQFRSGRIRHASQPDQGACANGELSIADAAELVSLIDASCEMPETTKRGGAAPACPWWSHISGPLPWFYKSPLDNHTGWG
jgi:hypothetical protein